MIRSSLISVCSWSLAVGCVFLPTANRQLLTYPSIYINEIGVSKNNLFILDFH